jgi:hypothetical protein
MHQGPPSAPRIFRKHFGKISSTCNALFHVQPSTQDGNLPQELLWQGSQSQGALPPHAAHLTKHTLKEKTISAKGCGEVPT